MMFIILTIPFYYCYDKNRYDLTKKVFNHYRNIRKQLKEINVDLKLMLIGSEEELSKSLLGGDEIYVEFDQGSPKNYNERIKIVDVKYQVSIQFARKYNPDILLMVDSNDIITFPFFLKMIEGYNAGYDFFSIAGKEKTDCCYFLDLLTNNCYTWNGLYPPYSHHAWKTANCAGGIKGWSNRLLEKVKFIDTGGEADETNMYMQADKLQFKIQHLYPEADKFQYWNIKVGSELHKLKDMQKQLKNNIKQTPRNIVEEFMKYYITL